MQFPVNVYAMTYSQSFSYKNEPTNNYLKYIWIANQRHILQ